MKLTVTTFVSLDGVMQGPGGAEEDPSGGFDLGGWLVPFVDQGFGETVTEWFEDADAFLLGRKTYDIFASFWPKITDATDPVATKLNTLPKYVPSRSKPELTWNNSHLVSGDVVAEIQQLKEQPGAALQVHGSGDLIQTLLRHNLVDELRLFTFPVTLGKGRRLFDDITPATWRLKRVKTTDAGVITQVYQPLGNLEFGTFIAGDDGKEHVA